MDAIERSYNSMLDEDKKRFLTITTEEVLRRKPDLQEQLQEYLERLGWTYYQGDIIPIQLLDVSEIAELPEEARPDLIKAATRLRDGDLDGAISAACGAVDAVTNDIYSRLSLGDPGKSSFQEKVNKSFEALKVFQNLEVELKAINWEQEKIRPIKGNLKGAINHAAFVMQTIRPEMGDVHGSKPTLKALVFDSLKWSSLILRLLSNP